MKMLNCPECGLTITDVQEECPKCQTKISDIIDGEEQQTEKDQNEAKETKSRKPKKGHSKKTEAATVVKTNEETANTDESMKVTEDIIAAVVEAEALAVIEEEKAADDEENICKTCLAPVDTGQNFCQLCGSAVGTTLEPVPSITSKSDEDAYKWIAAVGYFVFFIPILFGFHRKSKFVKYHTKQATILFISSTILFLVLVVFRNILDGLFLTSPMFNLDEIFPTIDTSWRHGTGVLFKYYLIGMIYALHLMPFAFMIIGFINSVQGKQQPLPLMGRFVASKKK